MNSILAQLKAQLQSTETIVINSHQTNASGLYLRSKEERELITGACFGRVFISLEEFFEAAFGHYAMGGKSTANWSPTVFVNPPDLDHAHKMAKGLRPFTDWSDPGKVKTLAQLYFLDGEPFDSPISSTQSDLQDMKTVRNATAHVSRSTGSALDAFYGRWTGAPKQGVSAYETIMAPGVKGSTSFMAHASTIVEAVGNDIATRS